MTPLRVAMIIADERDVFFRYELPTPYFGTAPTALLEGMTQSSQIQVHIVSCVRKHVQSPPRLAENIFYHSVLVSRWAFLRTLYFPCIIGIRKVLRQIRPDLVHGQGTERYQALGSTFSGYPNVMTLHGIMTGSSRVLKSAPWGFYNITAYLERIALRRTGGVFCNSTYTLETASAWSRRTWLIPNPVRTLFLSTKPAACAKLIRPTLLHVGVICENKQQLRMLQLARELWSQNLDFEIQFIGLAPSDNPYGRTFLAEIETASKTGYARHLGLKSAEDLVHCFDSSSALVHTPITETFGLVVAEGLARNLTFFGFRVGGVPDIAEGMPGATLVSANDWQALGNAIAAWIRSGAPKPPSPASELIRQRYAPQVVAGRHLQIYREVLGCSEEPLLRKRTQK